jgi:hypothetical protein
VEVLQAVEYMDADVGNSNWATGDWNGDGEFDARGLVTALQDGGYGRGPRFAALRPLPSPAAAMQVPEPSAIGMLVIGVFAQLSVILCRAQRRRVN